jgi:hypothetical protein
LAFGAILKDGFPRIPFVNSRTTFLCLVSKGADLVGLHLLEDSYIAASWNSGTKRSKPPLSFGLPDLVSKRIPALVESGYPKYSESTVWIAPKQGFSEVSEDVWTFLIGGYQVLGKWLKDRRGMVLQEADIYTYRRTIKAIEETLRIMNEIDSVLAQGGGFVGIPLFG